MKLSSKKGFSLVELIIVIAILGIIAVIAVPNLTGIQQRSQVNADIRTAEQIGKAVRIYLTDSGANVDRATELKDTWKDLASMTNLTEYIPTTYTPKSITSGTGKYWIKTVEPKSNVSGVETRVVVGIGADAPTSNAAYTTGMSAGIAYIEGISDLSATSIAAVLGS